MKRIRIYWMRLQAAFFKIHLVDRCLILFMTVLLLQSAYSMFFYAGAGTGAGDIDIIVRTSSAAIFGYFLSANFIRHSTPNQSAVISLADPPTVGLKPGENAQIDQPRNKIGFSVPGQTEEQERRGTANAPSNAPDLEDTSCNRLQIIVATCIGLFCLVTLLLMRNMAQWNVHLAGSPAIAATVAQFRDFVSGCVGFLIGCPTHRSEQAKP